MQHYAPEGCALAAEPLTRELLLSAMEHKRILQAPAVVCDESYNLTVDLGCGMFGIIPKNEAAIGIKEGAIGNVAIVTRVGKPVCFHVVAICGEQHFRLSRVSAQKEALQHLLKNLEPGDIVPAKVTSLADFGAFCDIGCGIPALLGIENISVSRTEHPSQRLQIGDTIYAVIRQIHTASGRFWLSTKELLGTWEENAERFAAGQTVTGIVRSIMPYGIFIELAPNLSGLAETDAALKPGDPVSVYIKSIQPERCKIKLAVVEKLESLPPQKPLVYTQTQGRILHWRYCHSDRCKIQSDFLTSSQ